MNITKITIIEETDILMEAKIITLSCAPTEGEAQELFGDDESIVLEF